MSDLPITIWNYSSFMTFFLCKGSTLSCYTSQSLTDWLQSKLQTRVSDKVDCFKRTWRPNMRWQWDAFLLKVHCPASLESAQSRVPSLQSQNQCAPPFRLFGNGPSPPVAPLLLTADRCFTVSSVNSNYCTCLKVLHTRFIKERHSGDQVAHCVCFPVIK